MSERLWETEEHFRTFVEGVADYAIFMLDPGGNVRTWNAGAERIKGYRSDEILGEHFSCFYPEEDRTAGKPAQELAAASACGRIEDEGWRLRKDGSRFWANVVITASFDESGQVRGFLKVSRDMSDHKRVLEELSASRARLAGILEIAEDAIISVDEGQQILLFNGGAERIFGYTAQEVLGKPLDLLLPERYLASHRRHIAEFARSSDVARRMGERQEVYGRRKDGSEFPAEASISRLVLNGETVLTAMLRDITARKQTEAQIRWLNEDLEQRVRERTAELHKKTDEVRAMTQQLWQAAKLASVGELAASIAHELNNPLATVTLRIESVLAQTPADDPRRRALGIIEQETKRMGNLVANLLQFSRRGAEEISTVAIRDELLKALELIHHHLRKRAITVVQELAEDTPTIYADRQKLRQVFLNLLSNACDAMPEGGTLTLRAAPAMLAGGKPGVQIDFSDTGAGIPPENLEKVMEPFFTTKEEGKGTGLGLAICRRVIQEHYGTINIRSTVGQGTTVCVVLPVRSGGHVDHLRGSVATR